MTGSRIYKKIRYTVPNSYSPCVTTPLVYLKRSARVIGRGGLYTIIHNIIFASLA